MAHTRPGRPKALRHGRAPASWRIGVRAALCRPAYRWPTIGGLLLAIEPLCLLGKHGPVPSHLLIRNLYKGISCLLRKLSRAIRFAPILICSKSHRPLTRARGVRSANRRCRTLGVGALAKFIPPVPTAARGGQSVIALSTSPAVNRLPRANPNSRAICFSFIRIYLIILRSLSPH